MDIFLVHGRQRLRTGCVTTAERERWKCGPPFLQELFLFVKSILRAVIYRVHLVTPA
jgi:hypothetical protein